MILLICKKTLIVIPVPIWYHQPWHSYHILSWIFEGYGITSQMEGYFSVLFGILLCHIGLQYFLYFVFFIIFVTEVFERPSGEESPQYVALLFQPYKCTALFHVEATWRLRENAVSTLFRNGIHVECLQELCWRFLLHQLMFFENFNSFFTK